MSNLDTFPAVGKSVTVVIVRDGHPKVLLGKTLVVKEHLLAIKVGGAHACDGDDQSPVTLMYEFDGFSYQLRGRISEWLKKDRFLMTTKTHPKQGERREFIRADMSLGVRVEVPAQPACGTESVAEWIASFPGDHDSFKWNVVEVDLSGSGARFPFNKVLKKGQAVAVSFLLPEDKDVRVLHLSATVVRTRPLDDGVAPFDLALEFGELEDDQRDLLNFLVFEARARELSHEAARPLLD